MQLKHQFTVPASVDTTWAMFNDLEAVAPCFPGAALTSSEGDDFSGTVKVKLGPVSLQYSGSGTFLERDEANHTARFEAKGKDKRGNGTAAASVTAVLESDGSGTAVDVTTDLAVTGKPAQFGRGMMQDVSDKLLDRFVACLSDKLAAPAGADEGDTDEGGDDEPAATAPTETAPTATAPTETSGVSAVTDRRGNGSGPVASDGPPSTGAPASVGPAPAGGGPSTTRTPPRPAPSAEPAAELDLGATVLPVLAKRLGPPVLGLLVVLVVLRWLRRR